jgi:hypothetical protein
LFAAACGKTLDPRQAKLLRERPSRAVLNCARQSGKSLVAGLAGLHMAIFTPGATVVIVSPTQTQSGELLRTVRSLHAHLDGAPPLDTESVLKIELDNGSRIRALPGSERSVRGITADLVIFDEASRCPDELFSSCTPMVATTGGALILLSTPAGKRGKFFDLWHNGDPAWARVRVPVIECPRISAEFLAGELKDMGPARYSEEYLLEFIDNDAAAFPTDIIDRAFTSEFRALWI